MQRYIKNIKKQNNIKKKYILLNKKRVTNQ